MSTDIVIPVYNKWPLTLKCIATVMFTVRQPFRLVVVDDGSVDQTPKQLGRLQQVNPNVEVVLHTENMGFTAAVNSGLRKFLGGDSKHVVLLNNDCLCHPDWLPEMLRTFSERPNVGAVMSTLDGLRGRHSIYCNDGVTRYESVDYLTMTCCAIKREAVEAVGMLDDVDAVAGCGQSDLDYGIRLQEAGYGIYIARAAFVEHSGGQTIQEMPQYQSGAYQKENYNELTGLRNKWGEEKVQEVRNSIWRGID